MINFCLVAFKVSFIGIFVLFLIEAQLPSTSRYAQSTRKPLIFLHHLMNASHALGDPLLCDLLFYKALVTSGDQRLEGLTSGCAIGDYC